MESVLIFVVNIGFFNWQIFVATYWTLASKTYFIGVVGGLLHVWSYLISLRYPGVLVGNLCGIVGYILLFILPNLFWIGLIFLIISIRLVMHNSPRFASHQQDNTMRHEGNA
ncbi:hypothetical protein [Schleiferilactobacillus perolens]|uniref:hypothetical protein n=1 Tax=Schleiferilactobacillus perolens TaxID=100468 RepID=UPI00138F5C46|nr:hypothetical protein [Schleiferilactobacillus perolens]MCI2171762.1 hypothetical protein [Schleiferilactobacillus perolens]